MYIVRNGEKIELTPDEILQCYKEQQLLDIEKSVRGAMPALLSEVEYSLLKEDDTFVRDIIKEIQAYFTSFSVDKAISYVFEYNTKIILEHLEQQFTRDEWFVLVFYYIHCMIDDEDFPSLEYVTTFYPDIPIYTDKLFSIIANQPLEIPTHDIWPEEVHTFFHPKILPIIQEIEKKQE